MRYAQATNIIQKGYYNLLNLKKLDILLAKVDSLCASTGKTYPEVANTILTKSFKDWYEIDKIFEHTSTSSFIIGRRYSLLAELAMKTMEEAMKEVFADPAKATRQVVNSLRVNLRIYCSNLFKAIDIFTSVYQSYVASSYIESIRGTFPDKELEAEVIAKLQEVSTLSNDIVVAISESGMSNESFVKVTKASADFLITGDLLIDDETLYSMYCAKVPLEIRQSLDEYLYDITRTEVVSLIEAPTEEAQEILANTISEKIAESASDLSIISDYQNLFDELAKGEDKIIRTADITSIDIEALEDSIIKNEITNELRDSVYKPKSTKVQPSEMF